MPYLYHGRCLICIMGGALFVSFGRNTRKCHFVDRSTVICLLFSFLFIVREDLLGKPRKSCPIVTDYTVSC